MSIFSPCSSCMTLRTRWPIGPMHAPLALTPDTVDRTAILVRCPASRAIAQISTVPSAISGTSSANSFFTRFGWLRDRWTIGPRMPRLTLTTRHLMRVPCSYRSPGTRSATGKSASSRPRSTSTSLGSRPCWMMPLTRSPSRPENSPNLMSSSASRSRWRITCFAVVAAMRPKPSGVSSYSPTTSPSSSVSAAKTVTLPVLRSRWTRAFSCAPLVLWYAVSSACSRASTRMSKLISFSRSSARSRVRSTSMSTPLPRGIELHLHARAIHVGELDVLHTAVDVERHRAVVLADDAARDSPAVVGADLDQPPDVATPVARMCQRAIHAGRGDLEGVRLLAPGVECRAGVEDARDLFGRLRDVVERDSAILVDRDPHETAPTRCGDVERLEVEAQVEQRPRQVLEEKVPGLVGGHGRLLDVRLSGPPASPSGSWCC